MPWITTVMSSPTASGTLTMFCLRVDDRERRDHEDDQAQRRRRVAMDHLLPRLAHMQRRVRICRLRGDVLPPHRSA